MKRIKKKLFKYFFNHRFIDRQNTLRISGGTIERRRRSGIKKWDFKGRIATDNMQIENPEGEIGLLYR